MQYATDIQRYFAATILFLIVNELLDEYLQMSTFGIGMNLSVLFGLTLKNKQNTLSGFYRVCASKTISNMMICFTFLIWAVPCTFANYYYLPHKANILFGQFGGWGPYIMGPFTQLCMAANRFSAIFLPFYFSKTHRFNATTIILFLFWATAATLAALGTPVGCGFIYYVNRLAWEPEESECAVQFATFYFYLVVVLAVITNTLNIAIIVKLVVDASVTQDCLHVFDMLNCSIISHLYDGVWFVFTFSSVSFLGIHVMDGTVMMLFNKNLRPTLFNRRSSSKVLTMPAPSSFHRSY